MAVERISRCMVAGALAWGACCAAALAADDGAPTLRLSTTLARPPAGEAEPDAARDAATPGFTHRTQLPVAVLQQTREQRERELLEALSKARRQQQATADIERRLAQVRSERYANPVVYSLSALLAIAIAAAALLWRRTRHHRRARQAQPTSPGGPELA